jgi:hypothetical protein
MLRGQQGRKSRVSRLAQRVRDKASRFRPLGERRRFGRLKGGNLQCNRGRVLDLSAGGMRLRSGRRYSTRLTVDLWTATRRVTILAELVWTKRLGFRRYEIGLEFRDVTEEIAETLTAFAAYLRAG